MKLKKEVLDPRVLRLHPKGWHYDKIKIGGSMIITGQVTIAFKILRQTILS